MILAFDTYYYTDKAKTVCLAFENWTDAEPLQIYTDHKENIEEYEPGAFYKRELPCIISLLKKIKLTNIDAVIIDGFVFLDDEGKPGLGYYLYEYLEKKIPVIGVAKTNFATLHKNKLPVKRGESKNPLFITATGIDLDLAGNNIQKMKGEHRIPVLLKQLDRITREA